MQITLDILVDGKLAVTMAMNVATPVDGGARLTSGATELQPDFTGLAEACRELVFYSKGDPLDWTLPQAGMSGFVHKAKEVLPWRLAKVGPNVECGEIVFRIDGVDRYRSLPHLHLTVGYLIDAIQAPVDIHELAA